MSFVPPFSRIALLAPLGVSAACSMSHPQAVDGGRFAVVFEAGRINGEPVTIERFEAGGVSYTLERSVFVYELDDPFQAVQAIGYVRRADGAPFALRPDDVRAAAAAWNAAFARAMPAFSTTTCSEPVNERSFALSGASWTCASHSSGEQLRARTRFLVDGTGLFVQYATSTSEKGEAWADAFWSSLDVQARARPAATDDAVVDPRLFAGRLAAAASAR